MEDSILAQRLTERPDLIEEMLTTLRFYASGDFYSWEGCHCHGSYEFEKGDKADSLMYELQSARYREED